MKNKITFFVGLFLILSFTIYFGLGFYLANTILKIDPSCGLHEGSKPDTWSTSVDSNQYKVLQKSKLRKNFPSNNYHIHEWKEVTFSSRDPKVEISGWLFNHYPNKPIVIVVHGLFPNGKCKPESNLVASLLLKNEINALTIDLRNYGSSTRVSKYENLGLSEYNDVLGAFDFLNKFGFEKYQIGLHGISLGGTSVIFAAEKESSIKAIWVDSTLAEFKMILKDEISRYGVAHDFGPAVSIAGKILTGIDPTKLSPAFSLSKHQNYFFTHGDKDLRVPKHHFDFFKDYANKNNIKANFWLAENSYHVDAMFKHTEDYGSKMKIFFESNLRK